MVSPISVTTTASVAVGNNRSRKQIFFQNTGKGTLYFKKQFPGEPPINPTSSSYDFALFEAKGTEMPEPFSIETSAGFRVVVDSGTGTLAVMETIIPTSLGAC